MANIFSAILSGIKKKKDEEDMVQAAPTKPVALPAAVPVNPIGKIGSAIQTSWNNFWQPSQTGVRARDFVRELPAATVETAKNVGNFAVDTARNMTTRPAAQAVLSVADAANLRANLGKGEKLNTIKIPEKDLLGQFLFGKNDLKSYQQQERDVETFLDEKTPLPKSLVKPAGIMLGITNAALDLPGGGAVKAGGKEVVEQGLKKIGTENIDDVAETLIKNSDELAPVIQQLTAKERGSLGSTLKALKEKGYKVADDIINTLKRGKVVEGDGYVLQANGNRFVTNFDRQLPSVLPEKVPPVAETKIVSETRAKLAKPETALLPDAQPKGVIEDAKVTVPTSQETLAKSTRPSLDAALKQTDESIAAIPSAEVPVSTQPVSQTAEDALTSRPAFENLTEEQKTTLGTSLKDSGFESKLAEVKGAPVTRDEVIQEAVKIQEGLSNTTTRQQTMDTAAKLQNTQNQLAQLSVDYHKAVSEGNTTLAAQLDTQITEELLKQRTFAADWGRIGNVLQNPGQLDLPTGQNMIQKVLGRVDEGRIDEVLAAWKALTPEDKANPAAIREFYFKFVEPTSKELMDEYRYINLLSSPLTHIRNLTGNTIAGLVEEPLTQVARGFLDRVATMLGRQPERTTFAREALEYYQGVMKAFPKALGDAKAVMSGEAIGTNAFADGRIPIGKYASESPIFSAPGKTQGIRGLAGKAAGAFLEAGSAINRGLEGADRFFKTLVESGYQTSKEATAKRLGQELDGVTLGAIEQGKKAKGIDLTFQNKLQPGSHDKGYLHQATDVLINGLMKARKAPGIIGQAFDTVFPFLNIAANIFNRTVDYLPGVGALNLIGAESSAAKEIAARQVTGGVAFLGSLWAIGRLAQQDKVAGAAPRDPDGKATFLAAHPEYSIKLGDTWVQTGNLGVFGKLAETAIRYYEGRYHENDLADSEIVDMTQAILGTVVDMSDQSYLDSLGLLIDSLKNFGQPEGSYAIKNLASTPIRQAIPLSGFQGWLSKVIDPVARKSESAEGGFMTNALAGVAKNLPLLSYAYDPYLNPDMTPSTNSRWNSISPARIQGENTMAEQLWGADRLGRQTNSAQTRFSEGKITLDDMMKNIQNAAAYFTQTPADTIDLGAMGDTKLPTKGQLAAVMTQPKGITFGGKTSAITGSQPMKGVSLKGKTKVSAAPKVKGIKLPKAKLSKAKATGVRGISLTPIKPPSSSKKKTGVNILAQAKARERARRQSASA